MSDITVTRGRRGLRATNGDNQSRSIDDIYIVKGASTLSEALFASGVPRRGAAAPPGETAFAGLRVGTHEVSRIGEADLWEVRPLYREPGAGSPTDLDPDPLLRPALITWSQGFEDLPADVDLGYRPVRNTAGDLLAPVARRVQVDTLDILVWRRSFPAAKRLTHCMRVNAEDAAFFSYPMESYHVLVDSIQPAAQTATDAEYVQVNYRLKWYPAGFHPYPHFARRLNVGLNGYYDLSGTKKQGRLYIGDDPIDRDTMLDILGVPFNPEVKVTAALKTPVSAPTEGTYFKAYWFIQSGNVITRQEATGPSQARPSGAIGLELVYETYLTCDLTTLME